MQKKQKIKDNPIAPRVCPACRSAKAPDKQNILKSDLLKSPQSASSPRRRLGEAMRPMRLTLNINQINHPK